MVVEEKSFATYCLWAIFRVIDELSKSMGSRMIIIHWGKIVVLSKQEKKERGFCAGDFATVLELNPKRSKTISLTGMN